MPPPRIGVPAALDSRHKCTVSDTLVTPEPLAILSNHLSTQNQGNGSWLDDLVHDHTWVQHYAFDRIDEIPAILARCAAKGVGTIAVDGGDGTAGLVFSGLLNDGPYSALPALALLPSGKTNMTAAAWSLSGDRHEAMTHLLERHRDGALADAIHSQAVVTLQDTESDPPRHGAFFGGADVVDGILYCRKAIYPLGLPNVISHTAAVSVLLWRALISGQRGNAVSAQFDGLDEGEDGHFFVVLVTTMDRMLLGMRPAPQEGRGPLHYMSLRAGPSPVLSTVPSLIRRRVTPGPTRTVRRIQSVILGSSGEYTLDGELYHASEDQPLLLSGHQNLRFIRW